MCVEKFAYISRFCCTVVLKFQNVDAVTCAFVIKSE